MARLIGCPNSSCLLFWSDTQGRIREYLMTERIDWEHETREWIESECNDERLGGKVVYDEGVYRVGVDDKMKGRECMMKV